MEERSIVMIVSVCSFVCVSVREHTSETARSIFANFCMLLAAVTLSSCNGVIGVVICYVLPVSWMI